MTKEFKLNRVSIIEDGDALSIKISNYAFRIRYNFKHNNFIFDVCANNSRQDGKAFETLCNIFNINAKPDKDGWYIDIEFDYDTYLKILLQLKLMNFVVN